MNLNTNLLGLRAILAASLLTTATALAMAAPTALLPAVAKPAVAPQTQGPAVRNAPPALLAKFEVQTGTLQTLTVQADQSSEYRVPVWLGADLRTMVVDLHDVRSPNFQLLVQDLNGIHAEPTPPCVTYRGYLLEEPNTRVAASIIDGTLDALIHRAPTGPNAAGEVWAVQPVNKVSAAAGQHLHIVYRAADTLPSGATCGTDTTGVPANTTPAVGTDVLVECELALEADRQYYLLNGSNTTATQNDMTTVFNQVDFIYDRDVEVTFTITSIVVTTVQVYTTNDPILLLDQFRSNWNANFGSVQRDLAHLFTGRNLSGPTVGIAYVSVICNNGNAYGLSQSRFSGNLNTRIGLTSHEVGHNFSAPHCNGSNPCYIMCATLGACNNSLSQFSQTTINTISPYAQNASCLATAPVAPVITGISPSSVSIFQPGNVSVSGQGLSSVTSYTIGGQTYTSGFNASANGTLAITLPEGTAFAPELLTVTNPLGTSNGVPVFYTATSPPKLTQTSIIPNTGGTAQFDFAGTPGNQWFFVLGISAQTTPFQGFNLLNNPVLFNFGTFNSGLGIESFSVPVPGGLGLLLLYTQILEGDANGMASGVSGVRVLILQ
ncbi:MAG: zinc-dependent metalloprotease family protein [Planctomycetota bacterium]